MTPVSAIPVPCVADHARARTFRTETLGVPIGDEGGDGARSAIVLAGARRGADPSPGRRACFHMPDVDTLAASVDWPDLTAPPAAAMPESTPRDPDGNRLCHGQHRP